MLRISELADSIGVSIPTLRRWEKRGKLKSIRTLGGHRRYPKSFVDKFHRGDPLTQTISETVELDTNKITAEITRKPVIYARVSSHKQKMDGNLDRQIDRIVEHVNLPLETRVYAEYGSGLNPDRRGLARLMRDVEKQKISTIFIEYKDRLTRFGYRFLEKYCQYFGTKIIPISDNAAKSPAEELSEDIMALLICFSGKLYSRRRSGSNYAENSEEDEEDKTIKNYIKKFNEFAWKTAVKSALSSIN